MYSGKLVFAQLMDNLPLHTFRRLVARYAGERKVKSFTCLDQYLCMAFAQLTARESLRDIETCLRAQSTKLYHLGHADHASTVLIVPSDCGKVTHICPEGSFLNLASLQHAAIEIPRAHCAAS